MNYLAHAYLSFNDPEILVGNLISDYVKGKKKFDYPKEIQLGIHLHRLIDEFTDCHEATLKVKTLFKPAYRLYAGAFADVVYDHFLALDENEFPGDELLSFSAGVYETLEPFQDIFPERFRGMFPYMKQHNWLYNYRIRSGIERSFEGLVRRASFLSDSRPAVEVLEKNYEELKDYYQQFFPNIKNFAKSNFQSLKGNL